MYDFEFHFCCKMTLKITENNVKNSYNLLVSLKYIIMYKKIFMKKCTNIAKKNLSQGSIINLATTRTHCPPLVTTWNVTLVIIFYQYICTLICVKILYTCKISFHLTQKTEYLLWETEFTEYDWKNRRMVCNIGYVREREE